MRAHLQQLGISLKHGQSLDLIAALAGLRNWPEVNAFPARAAAISCDNEACMRLATRIADRYGRTFSVENLRHALETPLPDKPRKSVKAQDTLTQASDPAGEKVLKYVEVNE